jgi:hypothetical protein
MCSDQRWESIRRPSGSPNRSARQHSCFVPAAVRGACPGQIPRLRGIRSSRRRRPGELVWPIRIRARWASLLHRRRMSSRARPGTCSNRANPDRPFGRQPAVEDVASPRRLVCERKRQSRTGDSVGVVFHNVHMHRRAVVCSTPTTQQIPAACAFAQQQASAPTGPDTRFAPEAATRRSALGLLVSDRTGHAGSVPASRRDRAARRIQGGADVRMMGAICLGDDRC